MQIHLVDTAGMERYGRLTRNHYFGSQVVLFVYDCDDHESFQALKHFYKDAKDNTGGATMVLVRNKIDKELQSVDISESENLACNHSTGSTSACKFMFKAETSAKKNSGIKELFKQVAEYLIKNVEPSNERNEFSKIKLHQEPQPTETPPEPTTSGCGC